MMITKQVLVRNGPGALLCLLFGAGLFVLGYWQGERSLRQEMKALVNSRSGELDREAAGRPPWMRSFNNPTPANASPEMKEFMANRATLAKNFSELRSQMMATKPPGSMQEVMQQFREKNKALLDRQAQLAHSLAPQRGPGSLSAPPPLQIPPQASPQMRAYLTARDQLMRDQMAAMRQNATADPQARAAAMQQWRQQNAARFDQLRQLAQALSTPTLPAAR